MEINAIEYLGKHIEKLPDLYKQTEEFCYDLPEYALIQARSCAVEIASYLGSMFDIKTEGMLYEILDKLKKTVHLPTYIYDQFHNIRIKGNKAAHKENCKIKIDSEIAIEVLNELYDICRWICIEFFEQNDISNFQTPLKKEDLGKLFTDALVNEDLNACYIIGMYLKQKADIYKIPSEGDYKKLAIYDNSLFFLEKTFCSHIPDAEYEFGLLLLNQYKTVRAEDAFCGIRNAAFEGHSKAQLLYGKFLLNGKVTENYKIDKDCDEAKYYIKKSANQENFDAITFMIKIFIEGLYGEKINGSKAKKYCEKLIQAGDPRGKYYLGCIYESGIDNIEKNEDQAVKFFREAANEGIEDAQLKMYLLYRHGNTIEKNYLEALNWLEKASENDNPITWYYWGIEYRDGIIIEKDEEKAKDYFVKCKYLEDGINEYKNETGDLMLYLPSEINSKKAWTEFSKLIYRPIFEAEQSLNRTIREGNIEKFEKMIKSNLYKGTGRNELCPCGSGKKYKKCCMMN